MGVGYRMELDTLPSGVRFQVLLGSLPASHVFKTSDSSKISVQVKDIHVQRRPLMLTKKKDLRGSERRGLCLEGPYKQADLEATLSPLPLRDLDGIPASHRWRPLRCFLLGY